MFRKIAVAVIGAVLGGAAGPAAADAIRIDNPVVDGIPVDWCRSWGQSCGWQGAHAFCRERGYERALHFDIFMPGRTYLMNGDNFCSGPTCTGLLSVTCKMSPGQMASAPPHLPPVTAPPPARPSRVRFDHPRNAGAAADWCSLPGVDCGWGGANKFCEFRGFDRAVDFSTYRPGASAVAGDGARCEGPRCVGLRHVVCERQSAVEPPPGYSATPTGPPPGYVPPPGADD